MTINRSRAHPFRTIQFDRIWLNCCWTCPRIITVLLDYNSFMCFFLNIQVMSYNAQLKPLHWMWVFDCAKRANQFSNCSSIWNVWRKKKFKKMLVYFNCLLTFQVIISFLLFHFSLFFLFILLYLLFRSVEWFNLFYDNKPRIKSKVESSIQLKIVETQGHYHHNCFHWIHFVCVCFYSCVCFCFCVWFIVLAIRSFNTIEIVNVKITKRRLL